MASSENTVRRAPWSAARRLAATIFSRFPVKSPTVGLIWASAIFTLPVYSGKQMGRPRSGAAHRLLKAKMMNACQKVAETVTVGQAVIYACHPEERGDEGSAAAFRRQLISKKE